MDQVLSKMTNAQAPLQAPKTASWYDSLEMIFDGLGLMRGDWAILKRFLFGAGIGTIIVMWVQPHFAFARGQFRPWKVLGDKEDVPATWMPWWAISIIGGLIPALFI